MQIWVDADACPKVIKEILYRVAEKRKIKLILVANATMWVPSSPHIETLLVGSGSDVADQEIVRRMAPGELVITADIPLAAEVIAGGGHALNPRGEFYTEDNIRERLAVRNFMDELRSSGIETGGPAALNQKDRQAFANRLDQFLAQQKRG
ncbi:MAG: YaiI/YqxD family protein [Desulfuromonadales bacterium]|nr:YaiI/YqxD family protein [Desulfuromonadales bacterium]